jgi:7,8-dihydroneopterin aldolase/epimerase/oxygenase
MGLIALEGMKFRAYHGFYEEDRIVGNDYVIDVYVETNTTDNLAQTINYETVYEVCKIEMRQPSRLMEAVAERIVAKIKFLFFVSTIKVRLKKLAPPLGGVITAVAIEKENSTTTIHLEDMHFFAHHGFYEEEQVVGNHFLLNVAVQIDASLASKTDDLFQTLNYETIYEICKMVMNEPVRLLETICERITIGLKHQFQYIQQVRVTVKKQHPPVGGYAKHSFVESEEEFQSSCGRCRQNIICYGDGDCWCQEINVLPRTQESIMQQYRGCLCKNCLSFFAN